MKLNLTGYFNLKDKTNIEYVLQKGIGTGVSLHWDK